MENLIEQLTAKNSEYIHAVTKQLMILGKTDDEVKAILSEILPQIIENQQTGILAKKTFGTPTEFVEKYNTAKKETAETVATKKNEAPVLMWLDSSLLFFGAIAIMNGITAFLSPAARTYGVITSLATAMIAGLAMYLMYRFYYRKARTKWNWAHAAIMFVVLLAWVGVTLGSALLPSSINIQPNSYVTIIVGIVVLVVRWWLKRQFNIQSALVSRVQSPKK